LLWARPDMPDSFDLDGVSARLLSGTLLLRPEFDAIAQNGKVAAQQILAALSDGVCDPDRAPYSR